MKYKRAYYQLLRGVTENAHWHDWVMFLLTAVADTARLTTHKIRNMLSLKDEYEPLMKEVLGASFNYDLLQLMFTQPYPKIELLEKNGLAHRQTASGRLKKLTDTP